MFFYDFPIIGAEKDLPLYLVSVGLNEWQYHVINKDGDKYDKILYCTKGSGTLIAGDFVKQIDAGEAFFIPSGCPHEYYSNGEVWDTHWVIPAGYACKQLLLHFGFDRPMAFSLDGIQYLEHCFRKMHDAVNSDKLFGNYRASGYLYDFLIELYRLYSGASSDAKTNPIVSKAVDYIDSNFKKQITLENLCAITCVSKQYLCRLFRAVLNCRPMEYIAKRRIQAAKELLSDTDTPIEIIADETGFCTSSYFCKLFRRYEGITPTQFRNGR